MNRTAIAAGLALSVLAFSAAAQETKPSPPPAPAPASPAQPEPKQEPKKEPPAQPSLDELLGLPKAPPKDPKAKPKPEAADPNKTDLERKLSSREVAEQFKVAVELMGETADRIQTSKDTGLATQRIQEDIIRKLDQMIKSAEQQQQKSRSSSKSKSQREQQQNQPNQQQQQAQGQDPSKGEGAPDSQEPPPGQAASPNPGTAARGAAWGALPQRVRDALVQGNADKYSALYQKWTEAYYRRLAEEGNK